MSQISCANRLRFGSLIRRSSIVQGSAFTQARRVLLRSVNTNAGRDINENIKATLTMADGTVYQGYSFGSVKPISGEVVFTTGMVGYTESLTDPSYRGQVNKLLIITQQITPTFICACMCIDLDSYVPDGRKLWRS